MTSNALKRNGRVSKDWYGLRDRANTYMSTSQSLLLLLLFPPPDDCTNDIITVSDALFESLFYNMYIFVCLFMYKREIKIVFFFYKQCPRSIFTISVSVRFKRDFFPGLAPVAIDRHTAIAAGVR